MKNRVTELVMNIKEWEKYYAMRDKGMLEFAEVKRRLQEPMLSISQLTRILGLKPTTVLNWDIWINREFKIPAPKEKKWRRFCILDLVGFAILKEMKKRGVVIKKTMNLFRYIKTDFCQFDTFVDVVNGIDSVAIYDFDKAEVVKFPKPFTKALSRLAKIDFGHKYFATVPLGWTIRNLLTNRELQKLFNDSFRMRVLKDDKIAITINGQESLLKDMPEKPFKEFVDKDGIPTLKID